MSDAMVDAFICRRAQIKTRKGVKMCSAAVFDGEGWKRYKAGVRTQTSKPEDFVLDRSVLNDAVLG